MTELNKKAVSSAVDAIGRCKQCGSPVTQFNKVVGPTGMFCGAYFAHGNLVCFAEKGPVLTTCYNIRHYFYSLQHRTAAVYTYDLPCHKSGGVACQIRNHRSHFFHFCSTTNGDNT